MGQSRVLQTPSVPLQGASAQVAPRHRALVVGHARQRGHLLAGLDVRHVQDLVHVQVVVLQLPEQHLSVGPAHHADAQGFGLPVHPVGGRGGLAGLVRAGLILAGLAQLAPTLDFTVRVGLSGLGLVLERGNPLHWPELAVDLGESRGFDSTAAAAGVGGNTTTPVDGRSCRRDTGERFASVTCSEGNCNLFFGKSVCPILTDWIPVLLLFMVFFPNDNDTACHTANCDRHYLLQDAKQHIT